MKANEKMSQSFKCPYWALEGNKECGMAKGGMYIPMPEHVRMFCLSSRYYQCRQYIKGQELIQSLNGYEINEFPGNNDRRRLQRYPEKLYLDLVVCDISLGGQVMNAYKAKSLDVSIGGLRVESYKEFSTDSIVSFVMDPDFSSDSLIGVGEVRWCEQQKDSNKFEAGIAFSNYSTSESMREYLEL